MIASFTSRCFGSDEIQQWDISDLTKPRLHSTLKPGVHPNMMHITGDGNRNDITNSLLSTADFTGDFWIDGHDQRRRNAA